LFYSFILKPINQKNRFVINDHFKNHRKINPLPIAAWSLLLFHMKKSVLALSNLIFTDNKFITYRAFFLCCVSN